jgi:hypothetical protein
VASDPEAWREWARETLRRCAEAENKIRHDFGLAESMGLQPTDFGDGLDDEQLRDAVGRWALGNICARRAAMQARGLTDGRSN